MVSGTILNSIDLGHFSCPSLQKILLDSAALDEHKVTWMFLKNSAEKSGKYKKMKSIAHLIV